MNGQVTHIAVSLALNNAFSTQKREFPSYDKMFNKDGKKEKLKTKDEVNKQVQEEFNAWARF